MYFYKRLYVSESIRDADKVMDKLVRNAGELTLYVLMLCGDSDREGGNQIEFCHCANLQQPYYRKYPPTIIGLARGRSECIGIVQKIVEEAVEATGSPDIRSYLFPDGVYAGVVNRRASR